MTAPFRLAPAPNPWRPNKGYQRGVVRPAPQSFIQAQIEADGFGLCVRKIDEVRIARAMRDPEAIGAPVQLPTVAGSSSGDASAPEVPADLTPEEWRFEFSMILLGAVIGVLGLFAVWSIA